MRRFAIAMLTVGAGLLLIAAVIALAVVFGPVDTYTSVPGTGVVTIPAPGPRGGPP